MSPRQVAIVRVSPISIYAFHIVGHPIAASRTTDRVSTSENYSRRRSGSSHKPRKLHSMAYFHVISHPTITYRTSFLHFFPHSRSHIISRMDALIIPTTNIRTRMFFLACSRAIHTTAVVFSLNLHHAWTEMVEHAKSTFGTIRERFAIP